MSKKRVLMGVALALTLGPLGIQVSQGHEGEKGHGYGAAVEFRESAMTIFRWYLKPMAGMVKGKAPYNQSAFEKNAEGLATATRLDVLAGFPKGSDADEETRAKPEIWQNQKDFQSRYRDLQRETARLAEVAKGGGKAAIKAQFGKTAKVCGGCHKKYRSKK